jgi:CubicO group peptidase (beta-lactamase class C family)
MNKVLLTSLLFLSISTVGFSQNFDKVKLDNYFKALEKNNKFMGSVAVSKNGKLIYSKSIGYADLENKIKATEKTKYRIGSITKSFTAILILKAIENKKLDINETIDKWFPTITNSKKITIKQLLTHRSGIHNFTNNVDYLQWNTQSKTEMEMIEIIKKGGSDFQPSTRAAYSNSNFVLLTFILERVFNTSYSELVQTYIVKPIRLTNTYVFGKINTANNESKSYNYLGFWKEESETNFTVPLGAGAITSTPTDLIKFANALFNGQLLSPESLKIMKTIKEGYGSGLFQVPFYSSIGLGHTGGIDGFRSVYSYFEDEKISYALTSNGTNMNNNDISIAVLSAVFNKPYQIPVYTKYALTSEELDKYLGVYATKQMPLKITVTKNKNTLIIQVTGQQAFVVQATEKDKFTLDQVGAKFKFNPAEETMILFQFGGQIKFIKE